MLFRPSTLFRFLKFSNQNYVGLFIFHTDIPAVCPHSFALLIKLPKKSNFK